MANILIHESRRLLLPFDTVVDALIELEVKHGRWPANAALVGVAVHDSELESARNIVLTIRPPRQEAVAERTYTPPIIAAAIVNYCLTMRVPMPRSSSKTIHFGPEGVALQLDNTLMLQRRHAEAPAASVDSASAADPAPPETEDSSDAESEFDSESEPQSESEAAGAGAAPVTPPQA